ncbi:hypothetical protein CIPAW_05G244200 [Carya illinoinensis]|uniref:Uncharacterized protein n=1 Tax=Carya illinoinensis TaxID=32201 RepID=A0A8T1QMX0_CARIL|nr:hypothetical protein CIPAW_05G244200 [Carya illinoinensis]
MVKQGEKEKKKTIIRPKVKGKFGPLPSIPRNAIMRRSPDSVHLINRLETQESAIAKPCLGVLLLSVFNHIYKRTILCSAATAPDPDCRFLQPHHPTLQTPANGHHSSLMFALLEKEIMIVLKLRS